MRAQCPDVIVAGAGPAGSIAAIVLARAGARVLLIDRARFPRPKLCGDTLNPGVLAILAHLGVAERVESCGIRIDGMVLSGAGGVSVRGSYGPGVHGRAVRRQDLDLWLLEQAIAAGARFEDGICVRDALVETVAGRSRVRGVTVRARGGRTVQLSAPVTIAADGRRSPMAFSAGLARHPARHRRWSVGGYFEGVEGLSSYGEMHVRDRHYVGVAPVPGGLVNACLVTAMRSGFADPAALLWRTLRRDPLLCDRFSRARLVGSPSTIGPLAVDTRAAGLPGLLLAGDAAGFIDPMTGDGLRFAVRGAELAARAALEALAGAEDAHHRLTRRRAREFRWKWRLNRAVRGFVAAPARVRSAEAIARVAPGVFRRLITLAGDAP